MLSPVAVLNGLAAAEPARQVAGIEFAATRGLHLDVYIPRRFAAPPPAVIFYYGGGWDSGERAMYRFVGTALAAKGMMAIIPDYRVYPQTRFPGFLRDAAEAVRWTHASIGEFGGDPRRIVLAGHSAGAHIAAMLAFERRWLDDAGLDPDVDIRGLVGISGPYDFLPLHSPTLKAIFGPESGLAATQPINFVDRQVVPTFLATGARDSVVDPANSVRLAERIRAHGGTARLRIYARVSHELSIGGFALPLRPLVSVLRDTVSFIGEFTANTAVEASVSVPSARVA